MFTNIKSFTSGTPGVDRPWRPGDAIFNDAGTLRAVCVAEEKLFNDGYARFILATEVEEDELLINCFKKSWGEYDDNKPVLKDYKIKGEYFGCDCFENYEDIDFFNEYSLLYKPDMNDTNYIPHPYFLKDLDEDDCLNHKDGSDLREVVDADEDSIIRYLETFGEDVYVPSAYEMVCMAAYLKTVNKVLFTYKKELINIHGCFWTATEIDESSAVLCNFHTGRLESNYKFDPNQFKLFIKVEETVFEEVNYNETPGLTRPWKIGDIIYKDAEGVLGAGPLGKPFAVCFAPAENFLDNCARFVLLHELKHKLEWGHFGKDEDQTNLTIYRNMFGCDDFKENCEPFYKSGVKLLYRPGVDACNSIRLNKDPQSDFYEDDVLTLKDGSSIKYESYDDSNVFGYSDSFYPAYVPSIYEMCLLSANLHLTNKKIVENNGRPLNTLKPYWTCVELDSDNAVIFNFLTGKIEPSYKFDKNYTRLIVKKEETYKE